MKKKIKIISCALLGIILLGSTASADGYKPVDAEISETEEESKETAAPNFELPVRSAVLMDFSTGTVLYEQNPDEALPPASVTKVMTLLLIMEAVDSGQISLDDMISVSDYAASMGGSQVYLEPGETMRAEDLIKSIVIASANDAALTMAEAVAGSESEFVSRMNARASELGMANTNFENVTGLDDDAQNHVTSARDIALMSRALMSHSKIFDFTTRWMDTIRDGAFGLTNTNRLIRFYNGATGLKTGSTSKAKFCISATAERDGLHLIAVIMGAETRDERNDAAKTLLDWGFANYAIYTDDGGESEDIPVLGGESESVRGIYGKCEILTEKGAAGNITAEVKPDESVAAPVKKGDSIGKVQYMLSGEIVREAELTADRDVDKISFFGVFIRMLAGYLIK